MYRYDAAGDTSPLCMLWNYTNQGAGRGYVTDSLLMTTSLQITILSSSRIPQLATCHNSPFLFPAQTPNCHTAEFVVLVAINTVVSLG